MKTIWIIIIAGAVLALAIGFFNYCLHKNDLEDELPVNKKEDDKS